MCYGEGMASTDPNDQLIDQMLHDGAGEMWSATQLHQPPCHVCGTVLGGAYIRLRTPDRRNYAACIRCANSRCGEEKWLQPHDPRVSSPNLQLWPVRMLEDW